MNLITILKSYPRQMPLPNINILLLYIDSFNFQTKGAFFLEENDFRKSFSPKPACLAATKNEIFRKIISYWPTFTPLTQKWFYTLIFSSNHFRKKRKREPRSKSIDCWSRRSSDDCTASIVRRAMWSSDECAHRSRRSSIVSLVERSHRSRLQSCLRSILPSPRDLIFSSAAQSQFDQIWWILLLGFVSFVNECGIDSLSACLQLRKCMENWVCKAFSVRMFEWTKHRNWFFVKRILWQPNTWKHFPFQEIAFPKNGIFSGNAFTRTKHSLSLSLG